MKKKILFFLELYDGIWSAPAAFFAFWLCGIILQGVFGFAAGTYDLGFIQPLFLAASVVIGCSTLSNIGLKFNFRGFHRFLYGYKQDEKIINESKKLWNELTALQKMQITLLTYFCYFFALLFVYSLLV